MFGNVSSFILENMLLGEQFSIILIVKFNIVVECLDLDFMEGFFIGDGLVVSFQMFLFGKLFRNLSLDFDVFVDKQVCLI